MTKKESHHKSSHLISHYLQMTLYLLGLKGQLSALITAQMCNYTLFIPAPAAAWCCSCCSPGPGAGCTSAGSQLPCESQSAPCSAAPPHAHQILPDISRGKKHLIVEQDENTVCPSNMIFKQQPNLWSTYNGILDVLDIFPHLLHLTLQLLWRLHNLRLEFADVLLQVAEVHLHLSLTQTSCQWKSFAFSTNSPQHIS